MKRLTHARLSPRGNTRRMELAQLSRLIRAIETMFRTERCIGPSTYRQDPLARVLVKETLERVTERFGLEGAAE